MKHLVREQVESSRGREGPHAVLRQQGAPKLSVLDSKIDNHGIDISTTTSTYRPGCLSARHTAEGTGRMQRAVFISAIVVIVGDEAVNAGLACDDAVGTAPRRTRCQELRLQRRRHGRHAALGECRAVGEIRRAVLGGEGSWHGRSGP